jgi:hypothetical protein
VGGLKEIQEAKIQVEGIQEGWYTEHELVVIVETEVHHLLYLLQRS